MDYNKAALEMHETHHGKVGITSKVEVKTRDDLSTAYTPGVAEPCRKIKENPDDVYKYTFKGNMVAVVSNGTAVLGLALANQILSACGKPLLPIDSAQLEQWVTAGLTSAAAIWAWWENNSFTKEALAADSYLEQLKKGVH